MPPWTDRNQHDPGLTLPGLLAWLGIPLAFGLAARAYMRRRRTRRQGVD